ncbi:sensor histidine kinase [Chryseobacterium gambrini]|jgi:signal transduction histidine kinase|uniref:sensor histidine kinase n=1 Tax=Chryseobacterium gambrini TaxID=373672 RepID=UPI0025B384A7|nr:HAMP domain-containing sensor histidine kinase [Chryseobacterium gambrini]MDN4028901.1 HAMP domain-containing sensor histidine kinase [Chryseobacterium gambrini]
MSKRLISRNTRLLLTWLPIVLGLCSCIFYAMLKKHTNHAQEKLLQLKQDNIREAFISSGGKLPNYILGEYSITENPKQSTISTTFIDDTIIYFRDRKESRPFKSLTRRFQWNGQSYALSTYASATEMSHLILKVFVTEAVILLLLLIAVVFINKISSRKLWRPFFDTVEAGSHFDVVKNNHIELEKITGTTEFDQLNEMLGELFKKVNAAYINQKQFVENASHELQTPLAIIRTKLELLINQPNITEKSAMLLGDITTAADRLSEMNRTLLLLSKIENNQFPEIEAVNVSEIIENTIADYLHYNSECELVSSTIENQITTVANRSLIEILVSNLVNNAIVHNNETKQIKLSITGQCLRIANTGDPLLIQSEELFERFKKSSHKKKTTGLGLAIVKQICQLYQFDINHSYKDGWHQFEIVFSDNRS